MYRRGRIWTTVSMLVLVSMLISTAPAFAQDGTFLPFMQNRPAIESVTPEPTPGEPYSYVVFMEGDGAPSRRRARLLRQQRRGGIRRSAGSRPG